MIVTGGKQHRVQAGETLKIELLPNEVGDQVEFEKVLMVGEGDAVKIGTPYIKDTKVIAEVVENGRNKKIQILKFKRRKHHMKQMGHRQYFSKVMIKEIKGA